MIRRRTVDEVPELVVMPYDADLSARRYAALMARAVLDELIEPLDAVDGIARFACCGRDEAAARLDEHVAALFEADMEAARPPLPLPKPVAVRARVARFRHPREDGVRPWSRWMAVLAR
jgi:hypothetical protein